MAAARHARGPTRIAVGVVMLTATGCTAPQPAASCDELAHRVAAVVIAAVDEHARAFPPSEAALPSEPGTQGSGDAVATAAAVARDTAARQDLEEIGDAARAQGCGPSGWADEIVRADVQEEFERRTARLDREPTSEEHVALNLLATILVVIEENQ